jgi:hypothetical protein
MFEKKASVEAALIPTILVRQRSRLVGDLSVPEIGEPGSQAKILIAKLWPMLCDHSAGLLRASTVWIVDRDGLAARQETVKR